MPFINGREDHDRTDMNLAAGQEALVKAVTKANPRTIVVLENSYPTTINWEQGNDPAILWTTHAGQETGHALADVLFGGYDPSGRLTQTWPRSQSQVANILDYDIIKSGQTYMYSEAAALPVRIRACRTPRSGTAACAVRPGDGRRTAGARPVWTSPTPAAAPGRGRPAVHPPAHVAGKAAAEAAMVSSTYRLAPGQTRTVQFR